MSETHPDPYVAVITLRPPEASGQATITLRLKPTDTIPGSGGKRLRDCTLAELQQYADKLEADYWALHQNRTLAELVADESIAVVIGGADVTVADAVPLDEVIVPDDWLDQVVVLDATPPAADPADVAAVTVMDAPPVQSAPDGAPGGAPGGAAAPESAAAEAVAAAPKDEADASTGHDGEDSAESPPPADIVVAQAEPVHPERERAAEPVVTAPQRTLGTVRRNGYPTRDAVDILLDEAVFRAMQAHAKSSMNREVAGFLIGEMPEKQPDGRYVVHVSDSVIAEHTEMRGASVTYTPESWRCAQDQIAARYPDGNKVMVGWYHTHPGFGIFLSNMDLFIHHNFFTQKWHIAFVLDPRAERSGFFCWDKGQTTVSQYDFPWPLWAAGSW